MELVDYEVGVISCIIKNLEMAGEPVPEITGQTMLLMDIDGFDSLRTLEIMVDLETTFDCEMELEDIFDRPDPQSLKICEIAEIVKKRVEGN